MGPRPLGCAVRGAPRGVGVDLEGLVLWFQVGYFVLPTGIGAVMGAIAARRNRLRGAGIGALIGLAIGALAFGVMAVV